MSSIPIHNNFLKEQYINYLTIKKKYEPLIELKMFLTTLRYRFFSTYAYYFNEYLQLEFDGVICDYKYFINLLKKLGDDIQLKEIGFSKWSEEKKEEEHDSKGNRKKEMLIYSPKLNKKEFHILNKIIISIYMTGPIPFLDEYFNYLEKEMQYYSKIRRKLQIDAFNLRVLERNNANYLYFSLFDKSSKKQVHLIYQKYILNGILTRDEYINRYKVLINTAFATFTKGINGYNNLDAYYKVLLKDVLEDINYIPDWKSNFKEIDPKEAYYRALREEKDIYKQLGKEIQKEIDNKRINQGKNKDMFVIQLHNIAEKRPNKLCYFDFVKIIKAVDDKIDSYIRKKHFKSHLKKNLNFDGDEYTKIKEKFDKEYEVFRTKRNNAIDMLHWRFIYHFLEAAKYSETVLQRTYHAKGLHYVVDDRILINCRNTIADILNETIKLFRNIRKNNFNTLDDNQFSRKIKIATFIYVNFYRLYFTKISNYQYKNRVDLTANMDNYLRWIALSRITAGLHIKADTGAKKKDHNIKLDSPIVKLMYELYNILQNYEVNVEKPYASIYHVPFDVSNNIKNKDTLIAKFLKVSNEDKLFNQILNSNNERKILNANELFFLGVFWKEKFLRRFSTIAILTGDIYDDPELIKEKEELEKEYKLQEEVVRQKPNHKTHANKLKSIEKKMKKLEKKFKGNRLGEFKWSVKNHFIRKFQSMDEPGDVFVTYTLEDIKAALTYFSDKIKIISNINPWITIENILHDIRKPEKGSEHIERDYNYKLVTWLQQLSGVHDAVDIISNLHAPWPLAPFNKDESTIKVINNNNHSFVPDITLEGEWVDYDAITSKSISSSVVSSSFDKSLWKENRKEKCVGCFKKLMKMFGVVKLNKMNANDHANLFMNRILSDTSNIDIAVSKLSPFLTRENGKANNNIKSKKLGILIEFESMLAVLYFFLAYASNKDLSYFKDTSKFKLKTFEQKQTGRLLIKSKIVLKENLKIGKIIKYNKNDDKYTILINKKEKKYIREEFVIEKDLKKILVMLVSGEKKGRCGHILTLDMNIQKYEMKEKKKKKEKKEDIIDEVLDNIINKALFANDQKTPRSLITPDNEWYDEPDSPALLKGEAEAEYDKMVEEERINNLPFRTEKEIAYDNIESLKKERATLENRIEYFKIRMIEIKIGNIITHHKEQHWLHKVHRKDILTFISLWDGEKETFNSITKSTIPVLNEFLIKSYEENQELTTEEISKLAEEFLKNNSILCEKEVNEIIKIRRDRGKKLEKNLSVVNDKIKKLVWSLRQRKFNVKLNAEYGEPSTTVKLNRHEFVFIDNVRSYRERERKGERKLDLDDLEHKKEVVMQTKMEKLLLYLKETGRINCRNIFLLARFVFNHLFTSITSIIDSQTVNYFYLLYHYASEIIYNFQIKANEEYVILNNIVAKIKNIEFTIEKLKQEYHNVDSEEIIASLKLKKAELKEKKIKYKWLKNYRVKRKERIEIEVKKKKKKEKNSEEKENDEQERNEQILLDKIRQKEEAVLKGENRNYKQLIKSNKEKYDSDDEDNKDNKTVPIIEYKELKILGEEFYRGYMRETHSKGFTFLNYYMTTNLIKEITKWETTRIRRLNRLKEKRLKKLFKDGVIKKTKDIISKFIYNINSYG